MRTLFATAFAVLLALGHIAAAADAPTLANVPPAVVKTVPQAGAADVPASTTEIQVTFSKKMTDKSWSWVTVTPESFPKLAGDPKFSVDLMTCVLPVSLEPGKPTRSGSMPRRGRISRMPRAARPCPICWSSAPNRTPYRSFAELRADCDLGHSCCRLSLPSREAHHTMHSPPKPCRRFRPPVFLC